MNKRWMAGAVLALTIGVAHAGEPNMDPKLRAAAEAATSKGLAYLRAHQLEDGSFSKSVGITGLALRAFLEGPQGAAPGDAPVIDRGTAFLLKNQMPSGAISEAPHDMSYGTSLSIGALADTKNPKFKDAIAKGQAFLKVEQSDEGEGVDRANPYYGGFGYEPGERPDMANQMIALDALRRTSVDPKDPVWQKAMVFISRSQNRTESNDQKGWVGNDGGFIYLPGSNTSPYKGTESFGSMTSAGLLSLLLCGTDKHDPRVVAAFDWIRKNYTLDTNPGTGLKAGIFYYYYAYAQAMAAMGEPVIIDGKGKRHNWRNELAEKLLSLQGKDGSWVNADSSAFMQDNRSLVTAWAVNALNFTVK